MNFVNSARRIQREIATMLTSEDIVGAARQFDFLDGITATMQCALTEIKLLRSGARSQIVGYLRELRHACDVIEDPGCSEAALVALGTGTCDLAPGITVDVIEVATADHVPDAPLYRIRSTGEFAIRVAGALVAGRVREIGAAGEPRARSWLWSRDLRDGTVRHIGPRSTLRSDILVATTGERDTRASQTAHDLLIAIAAQRIDEQKA